MAYSIVSITEGVRLDENNNLVRTRIVRWKVDSQGPFQLEVPAVGFDEQAVRRQIEEQARHVEGLMR